MRVSTRKSISFFLLLVDLLLVTMVICVVRNFRIKKTTNIHPPLKNNITNSNEVEYCSYNELVPHQVYLDSRPGPSHHNATVVSVSVSSNYKDAIIGCEVDGIQSNKIEVVDIAIAWFIANYFPVTHRDCFIYCFDMDISEYSKVNVLYVKNGTIIREPVRSESVVIPPNDAIAQDDVMVCAAGFAVVPHLDQWLRYQKAVGIKFIHINIDPSFLQNLNSSSTLANYVQSGFVKMVVWKDYLNSSQVYYYSQSLKYQDCALRYQGIYKYMLVIDFDEYFMPLDNGKPVLFYAKKLITGKVGSVVFGRQDYYCKSKNNTSLPSDGNMTKLYDTSVFHQLGDGKALHLVKSLKEVSVHMGFVLPDYTILNCKDSFKSANCYLAHLINKQSGKLKCKT